MTAGRLSLRVIHPQWSCPPQLGAERKLPFIHFWMHPFNKKVLRTYCAPYRKAKYNFPSSRSTKSNGEEGHGSLSLWRIRWRLCLIRLCVHSHQGRLLCVICYISLWQTVTFPIYPQGTKAERRWGAYSRSPAGTHRMVLESRPFPFKSPWGSSGVGGQLEAKPGYLIFLKIFLSCKGFSKFSPEVLHRSFPHPVEKWCGKLFGNEFLTKMSKIQGEKQKNAHHFVGMTK